MSAAALGTLAAALTFGLAAATDASWTAAGARRGVTLEFRDDDRLDVREVRASAEIPFPAARVIAVVCDFTGYTRLVPGVTEATRLAPAGTSGAANAATPAAADRHDEVYLRYAPRFLIVAPRDVVVRVRHGYQDGGANGCQWTEIDGRRPTRPGTVRIPLLRGTWTAEALDAARSKVVYQFAVRPGGRIPGWLVRRGATGALVEVIDNLRSRLRDG